MRADVTFILFSHPLFSADFPPSRNGAQDNFFAHWYREIVYEFAWEIRALVTAFYFLIAAA